MKNRLVKLASIALAVGALTCSCSKDKPTTPTPTEPAISVHDQTAVEGNTLLFSVTLDHSTDHIVTFGFATIDGTAKAGSDYVAASGVDTIPAGRTAATILVTTIDDAVVETVESFSLVLSSVTGAQVARSLATGTITDNDALPVSFASQVRPLLQTSCAKLGFCHGSSSTPGGGLFLGAPVTYSIVINATGTNTGGKVVRPDSSSASTLYTETTSNPPFGSRMPKDGPPYLDSAQQRWIRDWIDQGALDN